VEIQYKNYPRPDFLINRMINSLEIAHLLSLLIAIINSASCMRYSLFPFQARLLLVYLRELEEIILSLVRLLLRFSLDNPKITYKTLYFFCLE
jgi:hypothetical protein